MKKITAFTIHKVGENMSASVIYETINGEEKIIGMNGRAEITIGGQEEINAAETLEKYLNNKLAE